MSLKKKDLTSTTTNGLRVATDDPHLVSLGGGRLSTAVTIHPLPIGDLTIGSSVQCGVILNGTGVQPHHCTLYRSETNQVTLVPERDARTLIDGNKIIDETILSQGAMLTIGKSNYLRFNNPAEAELIKSTMGSNERISMPQIDFTQDCSSGEGSPEEVFQNLNNFLETHNNFSTNNKNGFYDLTKHQQMFNNLSHSPKVFTADSITVNASAKDVLGSKYNNFVKNALPQNNLNYAQNNINGKFYGSQNLQQQNQISNILPKINNNLSNNINNFNNSNNCTSPKLQPLSACYDRYPKPGSYGALQVFPMNGVNIDTQNHSTEAQQQKAHFERMREEELSRLEQERLDEILIMCAEYEKQNQVKTTSPLIPNRIKTNGSLPRDKNTHYIEHSTSPPGNNLFPNHSSNIFFPNDAPPPVYKKPNSGYENVSFIHDKNNQRRIEVKSTNEQSSSPAKYIPQSPRTKIKTCISPKTSDKRNDYDALAQSFEDRLRKEIQSLRENKNYEENNIINEQNTKSNNLNQTDEIDSKYYELKQTREIIVTRVRDLKTKISELQRQEDEVYREFDLENVLVSAELQTELNLLNTMEKELQGLQSQIHRLEAQRNANRVMQETQQSKLKQSIDVKEDQIDGLKKLIEENKSDKSLCDELHTVTETLENEMKMFEDLEFQYLEEETDWMAQLEDLNKELKILTKKIDEKKIQIKNLEKSDDDNQKIATSDTKIIESSIIKMLKELEEYREELKTIDREIFEISGQKNSCHSESEIDDGEIPLNNKLKLSNSLFGSSEILAPRKETNNDIMSKSLNENLIFSNNTIEMIPIDFTSTPEKKLNEQKLENRLSNTSSKSGSQGSINTPVLFKRQNPEDTDPLLKLKYNLNTSPPVDEKSKSSSPSINLNLSLESDDFEVNPLDKRVPSQDDIDRISKVTLDAPISTQGASYKVKESIKEIERNRQLLLAQQGTHVIEHERQKMNELKKKSHEEAREQYLKKQNGNFDEKRQKSSFFLKSSSLEEVLNDHEEEKNKTKESILLQGNGKNYETSINQQRHSHPELDSNQTRPLSELSDASYDPLVDKQYRSTNDICNSTNILNGDHHENKEQIHNQTIQNYNTTQNDMEEGQKIKSRLTSGVRRNLIPKSQRPLTRYLPIMSSHLDLRQHVEKAGHQITLCPHVIVDEFSCRGYLHKLGATFHGWARRWFVFDRQKRALIYYSDKSERKPRGGAYFTTIDDVYLDHLNTSKSGRPHCTFIIKTKKRSYHLQAASDAAARIWIDVIITGAQGNIDY